MILARAGAVTHGEESLTERTSCKRNMNKGDVENGVACRRHNANCNAATSARVADAQKWDAKTVATGRGVTPATHKTHVAPLLPLAEGGSGTVLPSTVRKNR